MRYWCSLSTSFESGTGRGIWDIDRVPAQCVLTAQREEKVTKSTRGREQAGGPAAEGWLWERREAVGLQVQPNRCHHFQLGFSVRRGDLAGATFDPSTWRCDIVTD